LHWDHFRICLISEGERVTIRLFLLKTGPTTSSILRPPKNQSDSWDFQSLVEETSPFRSSWHSDCLDWYRSNNNISQFGLWWIILGIGSGQLWENVPYLRYPKLKVSGKVSKKEKLVTERPKTVLRFVPSTPKWARTGVDQSHHPQGRTFLITGGLTRDRPECTTAHLPHPLSTQTVLRGHSGHIPLHSLRHQLIKLPFRCQRPGTGPNGGETVWTNTPSTTLPLPSELL